jgi:hypothetical protein
MEVSSARWRPWISKEVRDLIRRMSFENPLWGAPKIYGELLKIGIDVAPVHGFEIHGAEARSTIADLEDGTNPSPHRHLGKIALPND